MEPFEITEKDLLQEKRYQKDEDDSADTDSDVEMKFTKDSSDTDSSSEEKEKEPLIKEESEDEIKLPSFSTRNNGPMRSVGDTNIGSWEKHGVSVGSDFLKAFGWTPGEGLGKDRQGITKPIEVKYRPKGKGLGDGGEVLEEESKFTKREKKRKKEKKVKEKKVIISVEDILKEEASKGPVKIIDFRGGDLVKEKFPELRFNVNLLLQNSEKKLREAARTKNEAFGRLKFLKEEIPKIRKKNLENVERAERCKKVLTTLKLLERRRKVLLASNRDNFSGAKAAEYFDLIDELLKNHSQEWNDLQLTDALCSLIYPAFKRSFQSWDPFEQPFYGYEIWSEWKLIFSSVKQNEEDVVLGENLFDNMINSIWLPKIRSVVTNEWNVKDVEGLIGLLEKWMNVISPNTMAQLAEFSVLPKLKKAIELWDPKYDQNYMHPWILPWVYLLSGSNFEALYSILVSVRTKFGILLQSWDPNSNFVFEMLKPWQNVLEDKDFTGLIKRFILPQLDKYLQGFVIDPTDQKINHLQTIFMWSELLSMNDIYSLLEKTFFFKWLHTLYQWLLASEDNEDALSEIATWYEEWKNIFPQKFLEYPQIDSQFKIGIGMMDYFLDKGTVKGFADGFYAIVSGQKTQKFGSVTNIRNLTKNVQVSFKEAVEYFASINNILFMPTNRKFEGKTVYSFGKSHVVLGDDVVLIEEGNKFKPISLEELRDLQLIN